MSIVCFNKTDGWHCVNNVEFHCTDHYLTHGVYESFRYNFDFNPYPCKDMGTTCNPSSNRCSWPLSTYAIIGGFVAALFFFLFVWILACFAPRPKCCREEDEGETEDKLAMITVSLDESSQSTSSEENKIGQDFVL